MAKRINIKINAKDLKKLQTVTTTAGNEYYYLTLWLQDEKGKFGDNVSVCETISKEDRDANYKAIRVGNGWHDLDVANS